MPDQPPFQIGGTTVAPGTRQTVELPVSVMSDHTPVTLSVQVIHGRRPGPRVFVSAAVHGDEVIGVEIARRLMRAPQIRTLRGTLMVIPIVNSFGFLARSRYLPDRRDLNRSFPGSARGSLAARLAHLVMAEIVTKADFGIDLHSAAIHRTNLPQIRVSPRSPRTMDLAEAFGAPLILTAPLREGSLRQAAQDEGVDILLYEAGEGLRFDETGVRAGVTGILRVLRTLDMIPARGVTPAKSPPARASTSRWVRAPVGGLFRTFRAIGSYVEKGMLLGVVSDPFGKIGEELKAPAPGLIIGRTNLPVVNEGDGLFHIADISARAHRAAGLDDLDTAIEADPLFDEDEII